VSWAHDAHPRALELSRDLRRRGVACACDLAAGGDGDVQVSTTGVEWAHLGLDARAGIDAAVAALAARTP
jgi:hypothetical protein